MSGDKKATGQKNKEINEWHRMPERGNIMEKHEMNMEELEQVTGGNPRDWQSPADPLIDGAIFLGKKVGEGARWLVKGIKSIF